MISYSAHQNNRGLVLLAAALSATFALSGDLNSRVLLGAVVTAGFTATADLQTRVTFEAFLQSRVGINALLAGTQTVVASPDRTLRIEFEDRVYIVKA